MGRKEHREFALFLWVVPWSHKIMLHREQSGPCACRNPKLGVDMLDVVIDGLLGHTKQPSHLLDRVPACNQPQHLHLAATQACDQFATNWPCPMTSCSQYAVHCLA